MSRITRHDPPKRSLRVLIIDGHEISRAACAALLRTEGLDVVDIRPGRKALAIAQSLQPQVVLVDSAPAADGVEMLARALRALPRAPAVVLTSSCDPDRLPSGLAELPFLAKADVCAAAILHAIAAGTDELGRARGPQ